MRQERYEQVMTLARQGVSSRQIAHQLAMAKGTVLKYLRAEDFPEFATHSRPRQIDPYVAYLQQRWNAGEHHVPNLWREIQAQGYLGADVQIRRMVRAWRTTPPAPGAPGRPLPAYTEVIYYSVRKTRWLLMKTPTDLSESETAYVARLRQLCPPIAEAQQLVTEFRLILTDRSLDRLESWLERCKQSGISELVGFARGIRRDYAAVQSAVRYDWSQGPVEGHVIRLKMLKRQMYGRAGFALLRRRVLAQMARAP